MAALVAALIALAPCRARAQSAAEKEQARELMKLADAHMAAGRYDDAYAGYQAADDIMAVPMTRLWVCKAQERRGKLIEARERCLSVGNLPAREQPEPDPFIAARAEAAEMARALQPRIGTIFVRVTGAYVGEALSLTVDGEVVPASAHAARRPANPGEHTVVVTAGPRRGEAKVTLAEAEHRTVDVALPPGPPSPAPAPPRKGPLSPLVWIGFGAGAAGLIVGGVAGGVAAARAGDLEERCPDGRCDARDEAIVDDYDAAFVSAHVSTAGFILAGVGVAVGVVGLFLPRGKAEAATLLPWVGPASAGLWGRF
jgi:hypothetical protein